jgi:hypothetical protein
MEQQRPSNSLFAENAFAFMQFYRAGVKQVVGGTALAMASIALMMALARYGQSKLRQSAPSTPFN